MRNSHIIAFILALPPLAALGHDGYMAYKHPELGPPLEAFRLSDTGWLWANYSRDTFDWAKDNISEDVWHALLDPVLSQTAAVLAALPLAIFLICLLAGKMTQGMRMPKVSSGKTERVTARKNQPIKYKRK